MPPPLQHGDEVDYAPALAATGGPVRQFVRRLRRQRVAFTAFLIVLFLVVVAIFGGYLAPYDPLQQDLRNVFAGPSTSHWFGTDEVGRDVLSRMIAGTRVSLTAAVLAVGTALGLGVVPGLLAGFFGGWIDVVVSRVTDALMSFPPLLLAVAIVGILGPGLGNAMFGVGAIFAPRFVRLTRGSVLAVKQETYVEASRSIGTPITRIIRTRILPNILSPLIVQTSVLLGLAMLAEASLSFLGLGVQPPEASWGAMVGRATRHLNRSPTLVMFPGAAIVIAVLAFSLLGDGIRDSFGRESHEEAA